MLTENKTLTDLNLSKFAHRPKYTNVLIDALTNGPVKVLNVFGNGIPEKDLQTIMNSNKSIRTFGDAEKLDFSDDDLDDKDATVLADLLKGNTKATYLDVSKNCIGVDGAGAISEMLKINKTLTRIDLSDNNHRRNTSDFDCNDFVDVVQDEGSFVIQRVL
jgi:hypothetical protein